MTAIYILAIIAQLGVIVFVIKRARELKAKARASQVPDGYEGMRNLALQVTLEQLKLAIPANTTLVYGVVMDWNLNESVMTLAAYITGAANLYLNHGQCISGGGLDPAVGEAASAFVSAAQDYMNSAMQVAVTDLPPRGCIRFYLLTSKGTYAAQEQMIHFEDGSSPWLLLFQMGSDVISHIRSGGNGSTPH